MSKNFNMESNDIFSESTKEVLANNILIVKFDRRLSLNRKKSEWGYAKWVGFVRGEDGNAFNDMQLRYDVSFNWLMPILEQIESLGYKWQIGCSDIQPYHWCKTLTESNISVEGISPKDAMYGAVVEFIKWYNLQFKKRKIWKKK